MRRMLLTLVIALTATPALAQDTAEEADAVEDTEAVEESTAVAEEENGDGIKSPKTMSGMSILGNEEAPKSLVIVPWKSSRMGDETDLSDTLDDRARPVDKEVFERELRFYEIRAGEQT